MCLPVCMLVCRLSPSMMRSLPVHPSVVTVFFMSACSNYCVYYLEDFTNKLDLNGETSFYYSIFVNELTV